MLTKIKRQLVEKLTGKKDKRISLLNKMPQGGVCAEIGVWYGDFSRLILEVTDPRQVYLIDPWIHLNEFEKAVYGKPGTSQKDMDKVFQHVKDRFSNEMKTGDVILKRNFSNLVADEFKDGFFDWIYIDGNHAYEYIKKDIELYFPKVKKGGYICGDDYDIEGWWDNGVKKAVDEFVTNNKVTLVDTSHNQFIMQK